MAEHSTNEHAREHDHAGHDHDHGISHVTPIPLLLGVFGALLALTWITVAITNVDLGGPLNLGVGMLIATVKATLVAMYFMHLRWERPMNAIIFTSSIFFALLFVAITLMDRGQYREDIIWGDSSSQQMVQ